MTNQLTCTKCNRNHTRLCDLTRHERNCRGLTNCPWCNTSISIKKFCNHSCAAAYNNLAKPKKPAKLKVVKVKKVKSPKPIKIKRIKHRKFHKKPIIIPKSSDIIIGTHPKHKAKVNYIALILNIDKKLVTWNDQLTFNQTINLYLSSGFSPKEITEIFNLPCKNFTTVLKNYGFKILSIKEALANYRSKIGAKTDIRTQYNRQCEFKFNLADHQNQIPNYDLIQRKAFNTQTNLNGFQRDHIFSRADGFLRNIPPEIISHPANCQLLTPNQNYSKGCRSWILIDDLIKRINNWEISSSNDDINPENSKINFGILKGLMIEKQLLNLRK